MRIAIPVSLLAVVLTGSTAFGARDALPRFTGEREAAALFFVKKNLPDLVPFLDQLNKNNAAQYQHHVREIFQVTEMLADLIDEPKRYALELKIWQAENRAFILVARLSASTDERKKLEEQLLGLAGELVELDVQVLELKAEQLARELADVNDELARARKNGDKLTRERYDGLMDKARRPRK